jgi:hypothetical protein
MPEQVANPDPDTNPDSIGSVSKRLAFVRELGGGMKEASVQSRHICGAAS